MLDEQLTIACGGGAVQLVELQRAGRQPTSAEAFLRGTPISRGTLLGLKRTCRATSSPSNMTGRPFVGWQVQDNGVSVQGVLAEAVLAFAGERAVVGGAGRTDAGVHALGQVAHVDLTKDWPADTVRDALNAHLRPHPIAVLVAEHVADDFDARFSAIKRHYRYRIVNRRADLALDQHRAWRVPRLLDAAAMHDAAQRLVGGHDFTTFRSTECQAKSPVKTLDRPDVARDRDEVRDYHERAIIPAQSGALDGRLARARGRRQMERRRTCRRA